MMERSATIMGAIIGDTIGSTYEFNPTKDYNFPLYDDAMNYTDDSIMTIAVADWILKDESLSPMKLIHTMRCYGIITRLLKEDMGTFSLNGLGTRR